MKTANGVTYTGDEWQVGKYKITEVQSVMYDILLAIDKVCSDHEIEYILQGGTLIGACLWNGFIPWDDDVDISMTRDNYNKFRQIANKELPEPFVFFDYSIKTKFPVIFGKCMNTSTIFEEESCKHLNVPKGVWVDIFPFDGANKSDYKILSRLVATLNTIRCLKLRTTPFQFRHIIYLPFLLLPIPILNFLIEHTLRVHESQDTDGLYPLAFSATNHPLYDKNIFKDLTFARFESSEFPIPKQYDYYLKQQYPQWKDLPPESQRHPSHHVSNVTL